MKTRKEKKLVRREFIELTVKGAAAVGLAATPIAALSGCADDTVTVFGACYHDCPDRCSWKVTAVNNKVTAFKASSDNPYTAGKLCNKMENFPADVTFHPDRILTPLKRIGVKGSGKFAPIPWEQAITEVATKLNAVISRYGGEAVLPYSFGGNQGMIQGGTIADRFFAHVGASQLERTICGNTTVEGIMATNGQTTGVLPEDIIYSRFILLWGTNPILSNQHLWPLIQVARKGGAKVVVVDPFQSQTALQSDWHIQPLPGTDTVLALGMIHVILNENLQDQDYIDRYTTGIVELKKHVQQYAPEAAAKITGLERDIIIQLAREYAQYSPSLIRVLIGMEHQANGGSAMRAIAMLPALTGAWRLQGGGLMNMTYELFGDALNWEGIKLPKPLAQVTSRKINMIQLGKELFNPYLQPGIHALFVFNSNPVVTTPNQNLIKKGLQREDLLTVVLEHFVTDTARYADYVFPATTVLENWDLLDSWGTPYLNINQPAIDPVGEAKTNTEFFRLMAKEMDFKEAYMYETDLEIIEQTLHSQHEYMSGITFESLQQTGWAKLNIPKVWMPHVEGNFKTPSGKCMFYNPDIDPPLPEYHAVVYSAEELAQYPLQLLTVKSTRHFLNSSHANVDYLQEKEGNPLLDISRDDAELRGIADGDSVKVFNQRGEVLLTAKIRSKVRKGVVCMPQGYWPSLMKGNTSANALTSELLADMGGGGAFQENKVEVVKV